MNQQDNPYDPHTAVPARVIHYSLSGDGNYIALLSAKETTLQLDVWSLIKNSPTRTEHPETRISVDKTVTQSETYTPLDTNRSTTGINIAPCYPKLHASRHMLLGNSMDFSPGKRLLNWLPTIRRAIQVILIILTNINSRKCISPSSSCRLGLI
jgi:hypothetical protein